MNYSQNASTESISKTVAKLTEHNIEAIVVDDKQQALSKLMELIPAGASVMNGSSVTLEQIGFIDHLKEGKHGWNNMHEAIVKETDPAKQGELRQQAAHSDYYLGSAQALTENGVLLIASNTGSQLPNIVFTSTNLIFVIGSQKIVPDLTEAMQRLDEHVMPLEDVQSKKKWGAGTAANKILIIKGENAYMGRKVRVIIVKESLGF